MHHSCYYNLVSFIFGTTIPTSHILMKCFTLVSLFLSWVVQVHVCFFVECFTIPTCLCSHEPHPLLLLRTRVLQPHLSIKHERTCTCIKWLLSIAYVILDEQNLRIFTRSCIIEDFPYLLEAIFCMCTCIPRFIERWGSSARVRRSRRGCGSCEHKQVGMVSIQQRSRHVPGQPKKKTVKQV